MLLIQAILLFAALTTTWGLAGMLYAAAVVQVFDHEVIGLPWIAFFALCVAPVAVGAWLRAAYSHWPWWRAWLTWGLIVLVPLNALALAAPLGISARACLAIGANSIAAKMALTWIVLCLPTSCIAGVMVLLVPAGTPLGLLLLWFHRRARTAHFRLRRKRLRRARRA